MNTLEEQRIIRCPVAVSDPTAGQEAFLTISFEEFNPSILDIHLALLGDEFQRNSVHAHIFNINRNHFWLYGRGDYPKRIEVLGIDYVAGEHGTNVAKALVPVANVVQFDLSDEAVAPGTVFGLRADLTPSGILVQPKVRTYNPDGTIEHKLIAEGEIVVETPVGRFTARQVFDARGGSKHGDTLSTQVCRAVLIGQVSPAQNESMLAFHERLCDVLEDLTTLLGLCYRVPVQAYQVAYSGEEGSALQPLMRIRMQPTHRSERDIELINFRSLVAGGFQRLYDSFVTHAAREALDRSIGFLTAANEADSSEVSYLLSFAALECAINGLDDEPTNLSSSKFKSLSASLRQEVSRFAELEGLSVKVERIVEKLPELQRPTTASRLTRVCAALNVTVDDLWPGKGFDSGFKGAAIRRNELVHLAKRGDSRELRDDRNRVYILAERILLRALSWPSSDIWEWYDQNLRWINSRSEG